MVLGQKDSRYKWIILAVCFVMIFVCLGFCSGAKSLFLAPVTAALKINRSLYALNDTFRNVATAVVNLFFGTLLFRYGAKKMIFAGFVALIASSLLFAKATDAFTLCVSGSLLGVGLALTSTTIVSSIIRRWFTDNVGKYTGIVLAANGIGSAVAVQILSPVINDNANPYGYRNAYVLIAVFVAVAGIFVVPFLREKPKEISLPQVKKTDRPSNNWTGFSYQQVIKMPSFYLTGITILFTGIVLQSLSGIYAAYLKDQGLKSEYIATVISTYCILLTASKVLVGILYDKFGLRTAILFCQITAITGLLLMLFINPSFPGMLLAMVCGILLAFALPLETIAVPLITLDLFGTAAYDKILGLLMATNYAGYALGSPIANLYYDAFGSYKPALLIFSLLIVLILIAFQIVITYIRKEKSIIETSKQ